jgi:deoxyribodipyrimidine photo-lyase
MNDAITIFWFRRDLRLHDNAGLYHALKSGRPVVPLFIFDRNILDELDERTDRRVQFIHRVLGEIQHELAGFNSSLDIRYGTPPQIFRQLLKDYHVQRVFANNDYEPYALSRDNAVKEILNENGIEFHSFKDHVIFEKSEIVKDNGDPYTIFTPYSRKWKSRFNEFSGRSFGTEKFFKLFFKQQPREIPTLSQIGFEETDYNFPGRRLKQDLILQYDKQRNFPGSEGTSRLGIHLRFGTISIREIVKEANKLNNTFLNELIWRDFFQTILWHFPRVVSHSFKEVYDQIRWRNNEAEFDAWCQGLTGYPIVDAGMRELNSTGFMHNRVRMITASFLTKHLLIDWRWGEAYFAKKLLDYDLGANNGGWQWAAGCGCDAAPYFRIFNPYLQTKKFDPELTYIRKWVPEFEDLNYPEPIVEHDVARERCLKVYGSVLKK